MTADPHAGWKRFDDPRFELTLRYPDPTPQGRDVTVSEGGYTEGLRMHFASAERELYVEVVRFPLCRTKTSTPATRRFSKDAIASTRCPLSRRRRSPVAGPTPTPSRSRRVAASRCW